MEDKPVILIAVIRCPPEIDDEFNRWYDEVHIPMMFKYRGLRKSTRYKIVNGIEGQPNYLTIHKFENLEACQAADSSLEFIEARKEANESNATWNKSEVQSINIYRQLKKWQK